VAGQHGVELVQPGLRVAFAEAHGAVLAVQARRDRLEAPSPSWPPPRPGRRWWPGWPVWAGLGADQGWAGRGDRRLASLHRGHGRRLAGLGAQRAVQWRPTQPGLDHQDRQHHARRLLVEAAWHHRNPDRPSRELRARHHQQPAVVSERADAGNRRLQQRWCQLDARVSAPPSAPWPSPASLPDGAGAWPSWTPDPAVELAGGRHPPARGATRDTPMGSQPHHTAGDA
jgi:transposase